MAGVVEVAVSDSGWATSSSGMGSMGNLSMGSGNGINPTYLMVAVVFVAMLYFSKKAKK